MAVDGDPLADINVVIDNVRWVMKGGAVVVDRTAPGGPGRSGGSGALDATSGARGFSASARETPARASADAPKRPGREGGQPSDAGDKKTMQGVVERFLLNLGDHQWDAVAADLAPKALVVVARQRDGEWSNTFQTGEEWLAALRRNPNPTTFREPITNVSVTIDSDHLAYVRADFQVMRDGQAQSKGVDEFTLVRENGGWKLVVIAYTSLPAR